MFALRRGLVLLFQLLRLYPVCVLTLDFLNPRLRLDRRRFGILGGYVGFISFEVTDFFRTKSYLGFVAKSFLHRSPCGLFALP